MVNKVFEQDSYADKNLLKKMKKYFVNIYGVFAFAVILRLAMFGGFVMGDDASYADLVYEILQGHYPPLTGPDANLFSFRPLFLLPVAMSMKVFGWSEFSFVFPVLVCAVLTVFVIYGICLRLFNKEVGILAALLYAVFPLNLAHATTMTNDIMIAFLLATASFFFIAGMQSYGAKAASYFMVSGMVLGSGTGVKINSQAAMGIFVLYLVICYMRRKSLTKHIIWFFIAWTLVQAIFCFVYYSQTGNPLAHITSELAFRQEHAERTQPNTWAHIRWLLLIYPRHMFCLTKEGFPGYNYLSYGYFYWALLFSLGYAIIMKEKRLIFPFIWLTVLFVFTEFAFVNLWPYRPIVRLPRGLEVITVPTIIIIAWALISISKRSTVLKYGSISIAAFLIITSIYHAGRKAWFYRDASADAKKAFAIIQQRSSAPVITDGEMQYVLRFYNKYKNNERIKAFTDPDVQYQKGALVIWGGGRTMMPTMFVKKRFPKEIPAHWKKIAEVEGKKYPWRLTNLVVYEVGDNTANQ